MIPGYETVIASGNQSTASASTTWTDFAAILEVTPPKLEADDIETSHMTTPNQVKTYMPGWAEPGEMELKIGFEKAEATRVYGLFRQPKGFRLTFNDGSKLLVDGYIKTVGPEVDRENLTTVSVTIKVSGEVEFVEAGAENP